MPRSTSLSFLVLILLSVAGTIQAQPPQSGVDLVKTRSLFQNWTLRARFPDSITLAYYSAHGLEMLGAPLSAEKAKAATEFVRTCQRPDGGFVSNPKFGNQTNLIFTDYGLHALDLLGALERIDSERTIRYVTGLIQKNGGISPSPREKGRATLASTFYGVGALKLLGRLDRVDKEAVTKFILAHRGDDGGFGMRQRGASSPQATAMALPTLVAMHTLSEEVGEGAVRYLKGAVESLGTGGNRSRTPATMQYAAGIAESLAALRALEKVDTTKVVRFVESLYVPQNGGFGPSPGLGTTPPSAYRGVLTLHTLRR